MKKVRRRTATPSRTTLREIPEVDFTRYTVRRNRFAVRVKAEGIEVVHDGPSAESLAALPSPDLRRARTRAAEPAAVYVPIGKGRPRRGEESGPTTVRSVRLPDALWRTLEARAAREHLTVHAAIRVAILDYLARSPADATAPRARPRRARRR